MYIDTGIDIRQLKCFIYVVETNSFSKAAEGLSLKQSTVSAHILALEHKIGMNLIIRERNGSRPSEAGKILYCHAKEILHLCESAQKAICCFEN